MRISTGLALSLFVHGCLMRTTGCWSIDETFPLRNNDKPSRGRERVLLELELKDGHQRDHFLQSKIRIPRFSKINFQKSPVAPSPSISDPDPSHSSSITYSPAPQYPEVALQSHMEGKVLIKIETDGDGMVNSWSLEQSTGHEVLDKAAISAVKEWRLAPRSSYLIPFTFKIK